MQEWRDGAGFLLEQVLVGALAERVAIGGGGRGTLDGREKAQRPVRPELGEMGVCPGHRVSLGAMGTV